MEVTKYLAGTPSWVDLGSPDQEASRRFYGELFGWRTESLGPDAGGYEMFYVGDKAVAGIGPQQQPEVPPYWSTYICVTNAEVITESVARAGGMIFMPPIDVFDAGRMAVFADTTGAPFSVWEPKDHAGAELVNEPGTFTWTQLCTHHTDDAKKFYGSIFGWEFIDTQWEANGRPVADLVEMDDKWPETMPSHWMIYFAVDDVEVTSTKAISLGAEVMPPADGTEPGTSAIVIDPQGALFAITKTNSHAAFPPSGGSPSSQAASPPRPHARPPST